jgi:ABC-type multidrug transport system ATPase subunit
LTTPAALRTENLTKQFRHGQCAVDGLTLSVEAGQVYGFLGRNGAGKTTTIRMLLDLVRPTSGAAYLFGINPRQDRSVLRRVGALVEGAAFYPYLSGRANLELLRRMLPVGSRTIDSLLEQVGLPAHGNQRVGTYSTGMRQRLGIAAALLHDPDLAILDEPTNGLDPVGMVEIRQLIRALADREGRTVFLSSHLLGEVEQVCDRVAIIDQGRLIREGTVAELLDTHTETVCIEVEDRQAALVALGGRWQIAPGVGDRKIHVVTLRAQIPILIQHLTAQQIQIYSVTQERQSLEDLFLTLVGKADDA